MEFTNTEFAVLQAFSTGTPYNTTEIWPLIAHQPPDFPEHHTETVNAFDKFINKKFVEQHGENKSGNTQYVISNIGKNALLHERHKRRKQYIKDDMLEEKLGYETKNARLTYKTYWAMFIISLGSLAISIVALLKK